MKAEWSPRLNIRVTPEQFTKLQNMFDYGVKQRIFEVIIDDMIALYDKYGPIVLQEIINGSLSVQKFNKVRASEQATGVEGKHPDDDPGRARGANPSNKKQPANRKAPR